MMATITLAAQLAEARRELRLREDLYPRWQASGRLEATDAAYRLAVQREIVATLQRLVEGEQRDLFGDG